MAKLFLFRGRDKLGSFELVPEGTVVGRADDVDVRVENTMVSRRHCALRLPSGADAWVIDDLGGANGTWVNGERVVPGTPRTMSKGDIIELGDHLLVFGDAVEHLEELPTWDAAHRPGSSEESTAMVAGQSMEWIRNKARARLGTHVSYSFNGVTRELQLEKGSHTIGFTDDCKVRLPGNPLLGKEAARLRYSGKRWYIEPLSSMAGLKLNGERVRDRAGLRDGDELKVKGLEITFHTSLLD